VNIIYLEDNANDAQLVKLYANSVGHELKVVTNLDEFWKAQPAQYDFVLVDVMLRYNREGLNVPIKLRQEGYTNPVVAVTALTTPHDQLQCQEAGFTSILTKPYTIDQLANLLPTG
jgi:DNA-binding response OmpR family regulator